MITEDQIENVKAKLDALLNVWDFDNSEEREEAFDELATFLRNMLGTEEPK